MVRTNASRSDSKLIVFPSLAKLKYMDDEDDMCILQSEHDLDGDMHQVYRASQEGEGNSGNNKSATNDPVVIGENNARTTLGSSSNSNNRSKSY